MNSPPSSSDSSAFGLLDERIQRWIWQEGWTELKDAQERAIPVILEGRGDVIIAAATESGKTEAAHFSFLTRMLAESEPVAALYISPLKALINDQWSTWISGTAYFQMAYWRRTTHRASWMYPEQ